jgi:glycosyltransferase involved in cell wall biosynthesis
MLVGVLDFPSRYQFPPRGYAGIERWLWAAAIGARRAGATVHLLGELWRPELEDDWHVERVRLEDLHAEGDLRKLRSAGYDLLVVWHEYPGRPAWRRVWEQLDCDVAAFQHGANRRHPPGTYDGLRARLHCYSSEMLELYAVDSPRQELAVHQGIDEDEPPAVPGQGLVWVGRVVPEKAPHLAVGAARRLGRRITVAGPLLDRDYLERHRDSFLGPDVELVGELGGAAKTAAFAGGHVLVYTCARDLVEAGAAVFGEALRAGTPVAALAWRPGSCAEAALCSETGAVALADPQAGDDAAVAALADAVERASTLDSGTVQDVGFARFDPARHFLALATAAA